MKDFLNSPIGTTLVSIITASLSSLIVVLIRFLIKKLNVCLEKHGCETLQFYYNKVKEIVDMCVQATNQTYVNKLKDEGNFNKERANDAFDLTYSSVKSIAGNYLKEIFGEDNTAAMTFISNLIEETVKQYKIEGKETIKEEVDELYQQYKNLQMTIPSTYESLKQETKEKFGILQNDIMEKVNEFREKNDLSNPEEFKKLQEEIIKTSKAYMKMM